MHKKVIILSGAGISKPSGISTFRDSGGLWENHKIEDICSVGCLIQTTIDLKMKHTVFLKEL
jgi:NAD-dependent deacetylase